MQSFIAQAKAIPTDSKAERLVEAISLVRSRKQNKVVVFTEALTTQSYLRDLLISHNVPDEEITIFRGNNDSPRAHEALARWEEEVEANLPKHARPRSRKVRMKLALAPSRIRS